MARKTSTADSLEATVHLTSVSPSLNSGVPAGPLYQFNPPQLSERSWWSTYHEVEQDGVIADETYDDLQALGPAVGIPGQEGTPKAIAAAGDLARFVGRLYLYGDNNESDNCDSGDTINESKVAISATVVGGEFIITCAYWHLLDPTVNFDIEKMRRPGSRQACVSLYRKSSICEEGATKNRWVHLLAMDRKSDLAIFRIDLDSARLRQQDSILDLNSLMSITNLPAQNFPVVWAVVYNGDDYNLRAQNDAVIERASEFMHRRYVTSLSPAHQVFMAERQHLQRISFESFYLPCRRALAVGNLVSEGPSSPGAQYTQVYRHTVSGWSGCAGGMIGWIEVLPDQKLKARMIGIFKGETQNKALNEFYAFTDEGLEWIRSTLLEAQWS